MHKPGSLFTTPGAVNQANSLRELSRKRVVCFAI